MKIVSVMTSDASGGAEFAAIEMLQALRERGHQTAILSDLPGIGRDTEVEVHPISLGPKLSGRTWPSLALRWPLLARTLRRALRAQAPYDVLMLHYKKEQLLAPALPTSLRACTVWAEWGPVPVQMRSGPTRRAYLAAARKVPLVMAVSDGTRRSVAEVGVDPSKVVVVPNVLRTQEIEYTEEWTASGARTARDTARRVRGGMHLAFSSKEAQRRGRGSGTGARRPARAPDPRRRRGDRRAAACARCSSRRPRALHLNPRQGGPRRALSLRRVGVLPEPS